MQVRQSKITKKSTLYIIYGVFIALFGALLFTFNPVFAEEVGYNININPSLSVEVSTDEVSMLLNPASSNYDTKNLLITLGTNYVNGYNLYINSDSVNLTNSDYGDSNKYYINTLTGTATGTQADFPANFWGYRISSSDSGGDSGIVSTTNFFPFTSGTLISSANTATSGKNVTLTFATKIDYTKPAGLYTNTFNFSAVINPATYTITYSDNTGDSIANMPSPNPATGMISGGSATLSNTIPTRTGYTFKAWCEGTVSNSGTTCSGAEYNAGSSLDFNTQTGPNVSATLVAVWNFTTTYMQDLTAEMCANHASNAALSMKDKRDEQTYFIQKLADDNCWMLQNLKLGKNTTSKILTTADSDVSSGGFTLNGKLSDGKFTYTTVSGINYQNNSSQYYCTNAYGCYYNWYTATAGTGQTSVSSGNVSYSICPKGWTLPTGGPSEQFETLYSLYGSATAMLVSNPATATENTNGISAPGFLLGGNYFSSGASGIGSSGYYWSRTTASAQSAYNFVLTTSGVDSAHNAKCNGVAVRCILK